jgi:LysR family transcriptional activator for leuABCD operon
LARRDHPNINAGVTLKDLLKAEFILPHRRRNIENLPSAFKKFAELGVNDVMRVNELLEMPMVVASTDLLTVFCSSMRPLMKGLGIQVLPIPLELPPVPVYMIWHETRRNDTGHRWLRELVATKFRSFTASLLAETPADEYVVVPDKRAAVEKRQLKAHPAQSAGTARPGRGGATSTRRSAGIRRTAEV